MANDRSVWLRVVAALWAVVCGAAPAIAPAHGTRAGDLVIDHPYALPSPPVAIDTTAHLRALRNTGHHADRLLAAHTPLARQVLLRRRSANAQVVDAIELPPGGEANLRHDGDYEIVLVGLLRPLRDGDRFVLELRFEHAGVRELSVWVQAPRARLQLP